MTADILTFPAREVRPDYHPAKVGDVLIAMPDQDGFEGLYRAIEILAVDDEGVPALVRDWDGKAVATHRLFDMKELTGILPSERIPEGALARIVEMDMRGLEALKDAIRPLLIEVEG